MMPLESWGRPRRRSSSGFRPGPPGVRRSGAKASARSAASDMPTGGTPRCRALLHEMFDRGVAPLPGKMFGDQSPVALVRLVLAAQQDGVVDQVAVKGVLNPALCHELQEPLLVRRPP